MFVFSSVQVDTHAFLFYYLLRDICGLLFSKLNERILEMKCKAISLYSFARHSRFISLMISRLDIYGMSKYRCDICPSIPKTGITLIILIRSRRNNSIINYYILIRNQIKFSIKWNTYPKYMSSTILPKTVENDSLIYSRWFELHKVTIPMFRVEQ